MGPLALLALLSGVMFVGSISSQSDAESDGDPDAPDIDDTLDASDQFITSAEPNAAIETGAGNDRIVSTGDGSDIDSGDGNDSLSVNGDLLSVTAGAGDDTITVNEPFFGNSASGEISGGDGDDDIEMWFAFSGTINGDAGDDTISVQYDFEKGGTVIDGGTGDDYISLGANDISIEDGLDIGAILTGGDGADTFVVPTENRSTLQAVTITDFDPQVDSLAIDLESPLDPYTVNIVRDETAGITTVRLDFPYEGHESGALIELQGAPDFTLDDLSILGPDETLLPASPTTILPTENADLLINVNAPRVDGLGGNDTIEYTDGTEGWVFGGAGEDSIFLSGGGFANGNAGDDYITANAFPDPSVETRMSGDEGNDTLVANGGQMTLEGGLGDDQLFLRATTFGFGGEGNDVLRTSQGGTADGGLGDDTLAYRASGQIGESENDGQPTLTGGDGADTFELFLRDVDQGETYALARITDFDTTEDVLLIDTSRTGDVFDARPFDTVEDIEIVLSDDGTFTEVRVHTNQGPSFGTSVTTIRLDGVTDLSASDIIIRG